MSELSIVPATASTEEKPLVTSEEFLSGPKTLSFATIRAALREKGLTGRELTKAAHAELRKFQAPIAALVDDLRSKGYTWGGVRSLKNGDMTLKMAAPKAETSALKAAEAENEKLRAQINEFAARVQALERARAEASSDHPTLAKAFAAAGV